MDLIKIVTLIGVHETGHFNPPAKYLTYIEVFASFHLYKSCKCIYEIFTGGWGTVNDESVGSWLI